jgi:homocysteine S-methyltransferase
LTPRDQLDLSAIRVLDGGMATELEKLGCDLSGPLWSARVLREQPELIAAVHDGYLQAGADILLTAGYQVSAEAYSEIGLSAADAAASLEQSVELAERSRERFHPNSTRKILIAASLGPYGAALHNGAEYHGDYGISFDQLVSFHARRIEVLAKTNADLIAFETVPSLEEARAIVRALQSLPDSAAWITFTCKDERHIAHGEPIADCAAILGDVAQIIAIGVNCTAPHYVAGLIQQIRTATAKPIVVYPNSGEGWDAGNRCWTGDADVTSFGALAGQWSQSGAQIIGGCCRTGPEHIRAVRERLAPPPAQSANAQGDVKSRARRRAEEKRYLLRAAGAILAAAAPSIFLSICVAIFFRYGRSRRPKGDRDN